MTDQMSDDLEAQARALLEAWSTPRRRARPRVSRSMVEAEEHEIDLPSGKVSAWRLGVGPAVLLVHGWEDDNALWGPLADQFARIGRAVVTLDLPGHGFSEATDCSPRGAGQAVLEAGRALGPIDAIVGHSFGCSATMMALAMGLEAPRAVMIASPVPRTRPRRPPENTFGAPPEVVERALALRDQGEDKRRRQVEATLKSMTAQAMVIHSADDEQCPMENAERMCALWPGAQLMLVDGLGHRFVAQDAQVLERVVDFCEGM